MREEEAGGRAVLLLLLILPPFFFRRLPLEKRGRRERCSRGAGTQRKIVGKEEEEREKGRRRKTKEGGFGPTDRPTADQIPPRTSPSHPSRVMMDGKEEERKVSFDSSGRRGMKGGNEKR